MNLQLRRSKWASGSRRKRKGKKKKKERERERETKEKEYEDRGSKLQDATLLLFLFSFSSLGSISLFSAPSTVLEKCTSWPSGREEKQLLCHFATQFFSPTCDVLSFRPMFTLLLLYSLHSSLSPNLKCLLFVLPVLWVTST